VSSILKTRHVTPLNMIVAFMKHNFIL